MKITTVFSNKKYADYLLAVTKENYKFAIHPDNTIKIAAIDHNIITSMCILTKYNKNKYHLTALYTLSDYR